MLYVFMFLFAPTLFLCLIEYSGINPWKDPCFINLDFQFLDSRTKTPIIKFKAQEKRFQEKASRLFSVKEKRIILIKSTW